MEPRRTNGVGVKRVASEAERKQPVLFCLIICYLPFFFPWKEPRVVYIYIYRERERKRDFDAPMDTEEKSFGVGTLQAPPLGIHIKNRRHFRSPNGMQMLFTKGKVWKTNERTERSQGRKKSWYASGDSRKKIRELSFFLLHPNLGSLSLCGINARDGAGTHVTNSCQKCQTLISKAGWAGFFLLLFVVVTIGECVCVWLFRRVPSLFFSFHLLR